jgi:hypothetical protein
MAYDERLAKRVRSVVSSRAGVEEKKMFGGLAFLLDRHMFCGVIGADLWFESAPARPGRPSRARTRGRWTSPAVRSPVTCTAPAGVEGHAALRSWVEQAAAFAASLPPK